MGPGDVVAGRFEIERLAGSGGMASVYRARDLETGAAVALKLLHVEGADVVERFEREGRILAELEHPGIVRLIAWGRTSARDVYLALEWLEGETLADRLDRGGALTHAESVVVARGAAAALAEAHARGVVHRDVKPSNLFLVEGRVDHLKVFDFGVARQHRVARALTGTGMVIGTVGYIAPEQARGSPEVDARADVYALGCVLFECLTGRLPFEGEVPTAVLVKIVLEEPPRVRDFRPDVSDALDDLVASLLAKDAIDRPPDCAAVAAALARLGETGPLPASVAPSRRGTLSRGEQRLVCVVLAEGPRSDQPSDKTLAMLQRTVTAYGVRLERLADGSIVSCLRGTGVATDLAGQAARCALAVRGMLPRSHIAVTTGRAVVDERLPVGEAVDRAVRLVASERSLAREGTFPIRVDEVTAGLLDERLDVRCREGLFELWGEHEHERGVRTLLGKPTPLVGRNVEIGTLQATIEQCFEEPVARAVLVKGPAGIGKSRLRYEILRRLRQRDEPAEVWIARGDPMSAGSSFGMLAQLVRSAAGIRSGEPLAHRRAKLGARVRRRLAAPERERVTEFLGELAGVPFPDEGRVQLRAARQDPVLLGDQVRRAAEDFLDAECSSTPLLVVLEDLHWGDLPTVTFLDAILGRLDDRPLLVLALARPEIDDLFPNLWSSRRTTEIRVGELTRRSSERLVHAVLGDDAPTETVARLVEQAAGNAFFLEELIRAVAEGRGGSLPGTVIAMIQSRLEGLPEQARVALRAASVFGQAFWRGGVHRLFGGRDQPTLGWDWLADLARRELVTPRPDTRFPGQEEFVFRHALVREAAYATLTEENRTVAHRLAGEWLERVGEPDALVLAEHFERGAEPARAIKWYRRAAAEALEGNDFGAVVARVERAIACGAEGEVLGDALRMKAEAHRWCGEHAEGRRCGLEAMSLLEPGSTSWCQAAGQTAMASGDLGDADAVGSVAQAITGCAVGEMHGALVVAAARAATVLLTMGRREEGNALLDHVERLASPSALADPIAAARLHHARAVRALRRKDQGAHLRATAASVASAEQAGDSRAACAARGNLGRAYRLLGAHDEAQRVLREALACTERIGLPAVGAAVRTDLGMLLAVRGALDEGLSFARAGAAAAAAQKYRRLEAGARIYVSQILTLKGELDAAETEVREMLDMQSAPALRAYGLGCLAQILLARGHVTDAAHFAREATRILAEIGEIDEGESLVRLVHVEALAASGDLDTARSALEDARARLLARADRIEDPALRECFLRDVPENARTLELFSTGRGR